jgi:hypothetical protein
VSFVKGNEMKKMLFPLVVGLLVGSIGLPTLHSYSPKGRMVSMIELIATPTQHDGKMVGVVGFLVYGFEIDGLYLHSEDSQHGIIKNSLSLHLNPQVQERAKKLQNNYVIVFGTFSAPNSGDPMSKAGAMDSITDIRSWPLDMNENFKK